MTLPWKTLAAVATPDGELALLRRSDRDFLITIDKRVLMTSAAHRSEDKLAELGCAGLRAVPGARVLVSGLGMGYTLRAAIDNLAADAEVAVAELNPVVVEWCQGPLGALTQNAASDARVTLHIADVAVHIAEIARRKDAPRYHAIVLDMYEGPQTRVRPNDPLYGAAAARNVASALVPGGVLAVWGEARSTGFESSLRAAGMTFELHRGDRGALRHCVYVARTAKRGTLPRT